MKIQSVQVLKLSDGFYCTSFVIKVINNKTDREKNMENWKLLQDSVLRRAASSIAAQIVGEYINRKCRHTKSLMVFDWRTDASISTQPSSINVKKNQMAGRRIHFNRFLRNL